MEEMFKQKIKILDEEYLKERKMLDKRIAEIEYEKKRFFNGLDQTTKNIKNVVSDFEFAEDDSLKSVNNVINKAYYEGEKVINDAMKNLLDKSEECEYLYNKQKRYYEDEIKLLGKGD